MANPSGIKYPSRSHAVMSEEAVATNQAMGDVSTHKVYTRIVTISTIPITDYDSTEYIVKLNGRTLRRMSDLEAKRFGLIN